MAIVWVSRRLIQVIWINPQKFIQITALLTMLLTILKRTEEIMNKRVGIYARVSTKDQTIEQQLQKLREFCSNAEYPVINEYIDEGISAVKTNRPAFKRLLEDVRRRKVNTILVWKLDRFSRSLKELINTIDELNEYGANFISYSDANIDTTTASGKLLFNMIGAVNQFERDIISERTKLKLSYLKRKGIKLGRPRRVEFEDIVKFRMQGLSLRQIAKRIGCDRSTVSKVLNKRY